MIAYGTIYASLAFAMAAVDPLGEIPFGKLEKPVQEAIPGQHSDSELIKFFKGQ